jgi:hypothetical protein
MAKYPGIEKGAKFSAAAMEAALESKVSLTGDESISGKKTFKVLPVVPEKPEAGTDTSAGNNPKVIATEAQVYKMESVARENIKAFKINNQDTVDKLEEDIEDRIEKFIDDHKTNIDDSLSSKLSLSGDEDISGIKTFDSEPLLKTPGKSAAVDESSSSEIVATEAQVYKIMCW